MASYAVPRACNPSITISLRFTNFFTMKKGPTNALESTFMGLGGPINCQRQEFNSTTFTPDRQRGQHLKFEDRCSIRIFNKLGYSLRKTAEAIGCSASTVLNELRRGVGKRNGTRGRNPEYSAKRGQQNYEINRSRCHKPHKLDSNSEFVKWLAKQIKTRKWSLDACVGYARKHELFAADKIPCTKTLYSELWAGNLPITPFDVPEALRRTTKHIKFVRISAFLDPV